MSIRLSLEMPSVELLKALKEAGVPQRALALKLGLAPSAVTSLYKGERALKYDEAVKLQELLGVKVRPGGRDIPLIGMAGAGSWIEAIEITRNHVWVPSQTDGKFAVEVSGDSMDIVLPEGSTAIVDPEQMELFTGKLYLLINSDGEATIKRYRAEPARFEPVSHNPEYVPFAVGSTDFRVIGRVTGALTQF